MVPVGKRSGYMQTNAIFSQAFSKRFPDLVYHAPYF